VGDAEAKVAMTTRDPPFDLEAEIALLARDLSSPGAYQRLAYLCRDHDQLDRAVRWAEEGMRAFADRPDVQLTSLTAELLVECGRNADAAEHIRKTLHNAPPPGRFQVFQLRLLCSDYFALGGPAALDEAFAILERRVSEAPPRARAAWIDVLLELMIDKHRFEAAHAAARKHDAPWRAKENVGRGLERTHPAAACDLYVDVVRHFVASTKHSGRAVMLIGRMAELQGRAEHVAFLDDLKQRFARKRSFMIELRRYDESYRAKTSSSRLQA
jgi:hypothetical protein